MPGRPIISIITDFGTRDAYAGVMKSVLARGCPDAHPIDVTHEIPRHDVLCGSIALERAVDGFPPGTVHLAVVDPGVGTDRRILVARIRGQTIVCPDNGLITWPVRRLGPAECFELTWRPPASSATFHGRDVMAPAAAMLACGTPPDSIGRPIDDPILLDLAPAPAGASRGTIIHIDAFGNATTNIEGETARRCAGKIFHAAGHRIGPLRHTYADVPPGSPLALVGSSDLLEIAVRNGSAAEQLGLKIGDEVRAE